MIPNTRYILKLMQKKNWSDADLARQMKVDKSTVSRFFNGQRGAGKTFIAGLIRAFPSESIDKLFFLERPSSIVDTKRVN
ncbi:Helix-turn-helix [Anaerovirgula multivorans]|uniref:Helix-turn-helix n=1 Tax=Anaerovirgula multivorans TaxID=312168 RepID=A0A239ALH0_9FIRM|nr:helix-turn-helix transcriptional regulator [Anaerovirgula multivorans]SNR96172.1 Helix-turn-helix [Anaerovirgula multivorans]